MLNRQTASGEPVALAVTPLLAGENLPGRGRGESVGSAVTWLCDALIEGLVHFACGYQAAHPDLLDCLDDLRARRQNRERCRS